jgi:hypothetical protein
VPVGRPYDVPKEEIDEASHEQADQAHDGPADEAPDGRADKIPNEATDQVSHEATDQVSHEASDPLAGRNVQCGLEVRRRRALRPLARVLVLRRHGGRDLLRSSRGVRRGALVYHVQGLRRRLAVQPDLVLLRPGLHRALRPLNKGAQSLASGVLQRTTEIARPAAPFRSGRAGTNTKAGERDRTEKGISGCDAIRAGRLSGWGGGT